jgi:CelD/BcsL family acetyltransferase involved in cellulose biosynthesis
MRITEVDSYSDFLALEDRWKDVLQRCEHSVFSTWEWLSIWWKYYGNDKRLVILLAEENNKIVGIAPLMYSVHSMFGLREGKIEFIGTANSDYNDFIIADKREECLPLFIDYLNDLPEKWNYIELTDVKENSKCITVFSKTLKDLKLLYKCPYTILPKSYDAFLKGLSHDRRWRIRRDLRRLKKDFKVEFADYSGIQSCDDGMRWLFELHQKRFEARGYPGAFADSKSRSFHLDIARSFAQKGWLSLFLLKLSDNIVAALYGFRYQAKFYQYQMGFDSRYSKYSIGNQLIAYTIGKCIEDELLEFDFLRGESPHKDHWTTTARWNLEAIIPRRGLLVSFQNSLYRRYQYLGAPLYYRLKTLLKKS